MGFELNVGVRYNVNYKVVSRTMLMVWFRCICSRSGYAASLRCGLGSGHNWVQG
jgi:hypothetical protein